MIANWREISPRFLPFADAVTPELPLGRLLRLSLFQISVGMAIVLLNGTLNRVMIVELGMAVWLVSAMVSLPLLFAPLRVLIGFKSDIHRSFLGWRRVPYIWTGTMLQFGGFAIMPFALFIMSGDTHGPVWIGHLGAALAFLLVGAGMHTIQTVGLALATDLAPEHSRPRVVALLYVMLLVGMVAAALVLGALLENFSQFRLIQVIQGCAVVTMALNVIALWKQEARNPALTDPKKDRPSFSDSWARFAADGRATRLLAAVGLGTAAFSMQDILLEPYGGEILGLSVSATTLLTGMLAGGTLGGFALAARALARGGDPFRLAGWGAVTGVFAFVAVTLAAPMHSPLLFRLGTVMIGMGGGLFAVGMLTAAMAQAKDGDAGIALGAWGSVQATAMGGAILLGGALRDVIDSISTSGVLGQALTGPAIGYGAVYTIEIALLFATLVMIGPLVRPNARGTARGSAGSDKFGLAEFPG